MLVIVNNREREVSQKETVSELLKELKLSRNVAVFINGKQLLMAEYDIYSINEKDNIKIIRPLGGG